MAKDINELIEKGEELDPVLYKSEDMVNCEFEISLSEIEYTQWKAECLTYLEENYPKNKLTSLFKEKVKDSDCHNIRRYRTLLGYIMGIRANETDKSIAYQSITPLTFVN